MSGEESSLDDDDGDGDEDDDEAPRVLLKKGKNAMLLEAATTTGEARAAARSSTDRWFGQRYATEKIEPYPNHIHAAFSTLPSRNPCGLGEFGCI